MGQEIRSEIGQHWPGVILNKLDWNGQKWQSNLAFDLMTSHDQAHYEWRLVKSVSTLVFFLFRDRVWPVSLRTVHSHCPKQMTAACQLWSDRAHLQHTVFHKNFFLSTRHAFSDEFCSWLWTRSRYFWSRFTSAVRCASISSVCRALSYAPSYTQLWKITSAAEIIKAFRKPRLPNAYRTRLTVINGFLRQLLRSPKLSIKSGCTALTGQDRLSLDKHLVYIHMNDNSDKLKHWDPAAESESAAGFTKLERFFYFPPSHKNYACMFALFIERKCLPSASNCALACVTMIPNWEDITSLTTASITGWRTAGLNVSGWK